MRWVSLCFVPITFLVLVCCQDIHTQPFILTNQHGLTQFQFDIDGKSVKFAIQPNLRWRSLTYRSMLMVDDGDLVDHPEDNDSGHWRLSSLDDGSSGVRQASLSTDGGRISALIFMNDSSVIHISPGNATHHIVEVHDTQPDQLSQERAGLLSNNFNKIHFRRITAPPSYNCSLTKPTKYVEVLIVNDFSRYDMLTNWTTLHTNTVVNMADGYYAAASFDACIRIVLIGQLTFQTRVPSPITYRPCNTSSLHGSKGCFACSADFNCQMTSTRSDQYDSATLLSSFRQWRMENAELLTEKFGSFDAVHFFSGRDFDGQVRGLAYLDTICKQATSAVAVIESTTRVPSYHAQIFAHELGHNMGLVHDANRGFIMSPTSSALTFSTKFSSESVKLMDSMDLSKCFSSVRQMPISHICGDGIVDPSEECDPGLEEDDCCINCKLDRPRCVCSNTELCCENGQYKPANTICRPSKNSQCDNVETCTGNSPQCPVDVFEPPSSSCVDHIGIKSNCFLGNCVPSRDAQCFSANDPSNAVNQSDGHQALLSKMRSCPSTRLCSRLHCSSSFNEDCEQVWSSSAADGSPCGPNGSSDTNHVCIAGYCVASSFANNKAFLCLHEDSTCVADDLSVLDRSYWPILRILFIVVAVIVFVLFVCCCHWKRPLRISRPRRDQQQVHLGSHQFRQQPNLPGA